MSDRRRWLVSAALAFVAGSLVAVQGRINGQMGQVLGSGVWAAVVNFTVGLVVLSAVVLSSTRRRAALRSVPSLVTTKALPWWTLTAGVGGAVYVSGQGVTVTALGIALFTVATVAGQTGVGLLVDRYGLGPTGRLPVTSRRISAACLATVAVGIAAGSRGGGTGGALSAFVLLAITAGAVGAVQVAFNGRVTVATSQASVASLINFAVGLTALLVVVLLQRAVTGDGLPVFPRVWSHQGWLYLAGLLGAFFVVSASWAVRALGVLLLSLVLIAGALCGAVLLDVFVAVDGTSVTPMLLAGVTLTFASVLLAVGRLPRRTQQASSTV